jgi:hypothetical protein
MAAYERRELGRAEHAIVIPARRAIVDVIERAAVGPNIDRRALAAVAIAGMFSDLISSLASAPAGGGIVAVVKAQLAGTGLQLVAVTRN